MRRKKKVLQGMKQAFQTEGTDILFGNAFTESIDEDMGYEEFQRFSSRHLYVVRNMRYNEYQKPIV